MSVAGAALAYVIGAVVGWRAAPDSPFFTEIEERRRASRMAGPDTAVALADEGLGRAAGLPTTTLHCLLHEIYCM